MTDLRKQIADAMWTLGKFEEGPLPAVMAIVDPIAAERDSARQEADMHMGHRLQIEAMLDEVIGTEPVEDVDGFVANVAYALRKLQDERDGRFTSVVHQCCEDVQALRAAATKFDERLADIQEEHRKALASWDRTYTRMNNLITLGRWLHAEAVWQREQLRIEADHQWRVRRQAGHRLIDMDTELTEAVDLARWLIAEARWQQDQARESRFRWAEEAAECERRVARERFCAGMLRDAVVRELRVLADRDELSTHDIHTLADHIEAGDWLEGDPGLVAATPSDLQVPPSLGATTTNDVAVVRKEIDEAYGTEVRDVQ